MNDNLRYLQDCAAEILQYEHTKHNFDDCKAHYYIEKLVKTVILDISNKLAQYISNSRIRQSPLQIELLFDTPLVSDNIFSVVVNHDLDEIVFYMHSPATYTQTNKFSIENPDDFKAQDVWLEFVSMLMERSKGLSHSFIKPAD